MTFGELKALLPPLVPEHFLDKVSSIRVRNLTSSFKSLCLSVWLFESVIVGMLHPPKHVIMPLGPVSDVEADLDEDFKAMLDPALLKQRQRTACATISGLKLALSGSGKSHVLTCIIDVAKRIKWPDELSDNTGEAPINRPSANMSKLAIKAQKFNKLLHAPDEGKRLSCLNHVRQTVVLEALLATIRYPIVNCWTSSLLLVAAPLG